MDQKMFTEAEVKLTEALSKDPFHLNGLIKMAELQIRNGNYEKAFELSKTAISIDAHHGAANYYYGVSAKHLDKMTDAIDGFSLATMGIEYKSAAYTELAIIHAQNKNWSKVIYYAQQAIDYNKYNAEATTLKIIANQQLGKYDIAKQVLSQFGKEQPLHLFYKWLNKTLVLKNELPEESILELASFYAAIKMNAEVSKILDLLPSHPLAIYWKAYLRKDDKWAAISQLENANKLPTTLIFPFRTSLKPILEWATKNSTSWKPNYYLALLLHDKNKKAEALQMVTSLASSPTDAHFYGLRAQWNTTNLISKEADLQKAISLDPVGWRYYKLLTQLYIQNKEYEKALALVEKFKKSSSQENFIMDMLLAKSLLLNKKYKECDKLLSSMEVIPFEGSTDGRTLYWEAKMMQGVAALKDKNYKSAIQFINEAQEWPENLGAGKPYDADIDNRLEQYLKYICFNALHQLDSAQALLNKITTFKSGIYNTIRNFQPANHLITKWAYEIKNEKFNWNEWMETQKNKFPQFKETFNWVLSKANNNAENSNSNEDPWMRVIQEVIYTSDSTKYDAYIFIQKPERRNEQTNWELVWEDNFNKGYLDTTRWSKIGLFSTPKWKMPKEKWRDNTGCFRYITDTDKRVVQFDAENILLRGVVNNDTINGDPRPMLTGGIYSYNKFAFQYGRIEVRAKLDPAHGAWPAIWMLSEKDIYPNQNNGEMDIMERLNHDSFAYQTTHNHATITLKQETPKKFNTGKIDPSGYNTYSVSWYPNKLVYAINGIETITYPKVAGAGTYQWPFDQPFYLIIDQQLEGSWPGKVTNLKELPINMTVDWVRLYQ
jgi:beta-glucanase (GH16 family)